MITVKQEGNLRNVSIIRALHDAKVRDVTIIKALVNGKVRTIWERIDGYIFTKDGFALSTKDGYMVKCKDQ